MNRTEPPRDDVLDQLLEQSRQQVMRHVTRRSSARRRTHRRFAGLGLAAVVCVGGVSAAAATRLWEQPDAPKTTTTYISLGTAPADARVVDITIRYTCRPGVRYDFGLNPSPKHTGLRGSGIGCSRTGRDKIATDELSFDLCASASPSTEFFLAVTTEAGEPVEATATFAPGPSLQERTDPDHEIPEGATPLPTECVDHSVPVERPDKEPSGDPWEHPAVWPEPYYVNENGMTIGMHTMDTPDREVPDLVPATGTTGEKGFMPVRRPWTFWPDEVEAEDERLGIRTDAKGHTFLPLYEIDGTTRIGWVQVN